jgi:hypothetical protein
MRFLLSVLALAFTAAWCSAFSGCMAPVRPIPAMVKVDRADIPEDDTPMPDDVTACCLSQASMVRDSFCRSVQCF